MMGKGWEKAREELTNAWLYVHVRSFLTFDFCVALVLGRELRLRCVLPKRPPLNEMMRNIISFKVNVNAQRYYYIFKGR